MLLQEYRDSVKLSSRRSRVAATFLSLLRRTYGRIKTSWRTRYPWRRDCTAPCPWRRVLVLRNRNGREYPSASAVPLECGVEGSLVIAGESFIRGCSSAAGAGRASGGPDGGGGNSV